ncbi:uncharacterized protein M421DRAFT_189614 [Didymella exigua CBS 183.55]|uniref:Uncharacterized protein n=1 Tax=Didymella exigua CBS 183.55 TaxID=1150837 RepID=A0A6A5RNF1_9PLEO|nr:uncharacterized protein M421DRAFT_189614 [Didymella exigua CBS 183.55]KAF1927047.1 hypothetical protein M421DRAFT_189614 [Didymella exigua CBS 183.55]
MGFWSEHYWQDFFLVLPFRSAPFLDSGTACIFDLMFLSHISQPHLVPSTYHILVISGSLLYTTHLYSGNGRFMR